MNKKTIVLISLIVVTAIIAVVSVFSLQRRRIILLEEDLSDVYMVVALTNGPHAYRFMLKDDNVVVVSFGRRASQGGRILEITSMAFMGSVIDEVELTLDADTYERIKNLAEEIVAEDEGELWITSGALDMIIATHDIVYEVTYIRSFGLKKINELAAILKENAPIDIHHTFDRAW